MAIPNLYRIKGILGRILSPSEKGALPWSEIVQPTAQFADFSNQLGQALVQASLFGCVRAAIAGNAGRLEVMGAQPSGSLIWIMGLFSVAGEFNIIPGAAGFTGAAPTAITGRVVGRTPSQATVQSSHGAVMGGATWPRISWAGPVLIIPSMYVAPGTVWTVESNTVNEVLNAALYVQDVPGDIGPPALP